MELLITWGIFSAIYFSFLLFFWRQADEVSTSELDYIRSEWYSAISDGLKLLEDEDCQYDYYWLVKEGE